MALYDPIALEAAFSTIGSSSCSIVCLYEKLGEM